MVTDTTFAAYDSVITDIIPKLTEKVLAFIDSRGEYGATIREVVDLVGHGDYTSYAPCCTRLLQAGTVVRVGKRANRSGRAAYILVTATNFARMQEGGDPGE